MIIMLPISSKDNPRSIALQAATERQLKLGPVWIACWNAAAAAADLGITISQSAAVAIEAGKGGMEEEAMVAARCAQYAADTVLQVRCEV